MSQNSLTVTCEKAYKDFRLELNETFSLSGITAIFGPSGAGKSSLLKLIAGLDTPDTGHISFGDSVWFGDGINVPAQKRDAGYLFQSGALFSHLTVQKNLLFADKRSRHVKLGVSYDGVVETLGLSPLLNRKPQTLSGGEKQRVAIGRILLSRPRLLLLDEPLTGLDRARKRELLPLIKSWLGEFNLPCLYVSHDVEDVTTIADHLLILKDGETQAYGPAIETLNQIDSLSLSGLNIDPGRVFDAKIIHIAQDMMTLEIGRAQLLLPAQYGLKDGEIIRLRIRSQDVSIATTPPQNISIQNSIKGRITQITPVSGTAFFDVGINISGETKTANIINSRITRHAAESLNLTTGQAVFALIKTASLQR